MDGSTGFQTSVSGCRSSKPAWKQACKTLGCWAREKRQHRPSRPQVRPFDLPASSQVGGKSTLEHYR